MTIINSVLGPLDTADMGFTLSHEHILETAAGIPQVYPEFVDREAVIRDGIAIFKRVYAEGVRTIVDVTTMDLGRDIEVIERISRGPEST